MNRIPCKKCPQCGLFNDFTIEECECGKKLDSIEAQFIDTDKLSPEQYGEIDVSLKVYVQKCSACGALNYTDDPGHPVRVCYNCHKTRIATISPVECVENAQDTSAPEVSMPSAVSSSNAKQFNGQAPQGQLSYAADDDDDNDDDDDDNFVHWQSVILSNLRKTAGSAPEASHATPAQQGDQRSAEQRTAQTPSGFDTDGDDDDDDDEEVRDWPNVLDPTSNQNNSPAPGAQAVTPPAKKNMTLTAIRYGRLSFAVEAGQDTYMLGRAAMHGSFLSQDCRVGNEHCYLFYRNGAWYVRDNNSRNGTAVNSRDIGENGECMLSDGDELKLGHHPDSMAFRITIN